MANKSGAEALTQQIGEVRDRAADLLASDGGSRGGSRWPGRLLWFGLGMGVGAAAAGGRLLDVLPTRLGSRLDDLSSQAAAAASALAEKAGSFGGDASGRAGEATSPEDVTIDGPAQAAKAGTEGVVDLTPTGVAGSS